MVLNEHQAEITAETNKFLDNLIENQKNDIIF